MVVANDVITVLYNELTIRFKNNIVNYHRNVYNPILHSAD